MWKKGNHHALLHDVTCKLVQSHGKTIKVPQKIKKTKQNKKNPKQPPTTQQFHFWVFN